MKKHRGKPIIQINDPKIAKYSEDHTTPESADIQRLIENSDQELEYIDMLSGRVVGQLLKMLITVSGAETILEIGTFTGYSAIMMAEALPAYGKVFTLEMNLRYQEMAEKHFKMAASGEKIHLIKGNAMETLDDLPGPFDLAFLDGDKLRYPEYFEKILSRLRRGGLIVADNVLWDGTVLSPEDPKAQTLARFNQMVQNDERVEQVLLPVRDGVNVIRKL